MTNEELEAWAVEFDGIAERRAALAVRYTVESERYRSQAAKCDPDSAADFVAAAESYAVDATGYTADAERYTARAAFIRSHKVVTQ